MRPYNPQIKMRRRNHALRILIGPFMLNIIRKTGASLTGDISIKA